MMRRGGGRAGVHMREGSEARERANRGPCFTNCHLRGSNGGMRGKKYNYRLAPDCTQVPSNTASCTHGCTHTQTQRIRFQVDNKTQMCTNAI